jgi:hypothetical protein
MGAKGEFFLTHILEKDLAYPACIPPYIGVLKMSKTEHKCEFSPVSPTYPQFFASYPQFPV